MDVTHACDYITSEPHHELERVVRASGFNPRDNFDWKDFWENLARELPRTRTNLVVTRRINPFSPAMHLTSFFSSAPICPSNQLNVVNEADADRARALCVLFNSIIFLAQFFLLKEESTGRFIDVRFYDIEQMNIYPPDEIVAGLLEVFNKFGNREFPSLVVQMDMDFDERYHDFWERQRQVGGQGTMWSILDQPIRPSPIRMAFDMEVCQALGIPTTEEELTSIYDILVKEMILTKGLRRD